jgi:hypothetical protein
MTKGFGAKAVETGIINTDDVMPVSSSHTGDCMPRCLALLDLGLFPGAVIVAGNVWFWDAREKYYDGIFSWHAWLTVDGQILDSYRQLSYALTYNQFKHRPIGAMTARVGTATEAPRLPGCTRKGADVVYIPGVLFSPNMAVHSDAETAIHQTATNGCVDVDFARQAWPCIISHRIISQTA